MNDRELLELAAKAAGIQIDFTSTNGGGRFNSGFDNAGNAVLDWHNDVKWNPLADDGDALRLAVKLGMNVEINDNYVLACTYGNFSEPSKPDQYAAARRAITRAAAAMACNGETV